MAVTATPYRKFLLKLATAGVIDLSDAGTVLKVSLHTVTYSPNRDTDEFFDDVTNECASSGNYTAGGEVLTGVLVDVDGTGHFAYVDADDLVWTALTTTARIGVLRDATTGVAATSPLLGWVDFGANQSPAGVDFTLEWAAPASGGVIKVG
jgi:hypothetical protein